MKLRRSPNPNRNHPLHCPYCASTVLLPEIDTEFAWECLECTRVFEVKYHGQNEADALITPAVSTTSALQNSLRKRGHTL
ncbi:hypothetical protein P4N68_11745 [Corynebacterium felinum]|uniref:Transposase-like protein n=1 Tax=Corynebacterium felinum TaxID=131318 RepID=A0ABU2B5T0_9CORY|nr:hypothetical protein [Corynebacterium felinum]MDF5821743.1 hypothetical protein [Corynebacterium felinum]MDR7353965.1 transposase-like protein [Corynebacterium felinum]WJY96138.1 hypothetical protein CFELI_12795 [Corynebacterium felinum]